MVVRPLLAGNHEDASTACQSDIVSTVSVRCRRNCSYSFGFFPRGKGELCRKVDAAQEYEVDLGATGPDKRIR